MSLPAVVFNQVGKSYPQYHHITGGIKNFVFHLPSVLRAVRDSRYVALQDINFSVKQGECLGLIGRNGAGKSTSLGLIAGVLKPTVGQVTVSLRVSPLLELGAGFNPDLTGRENIFLNGVLLGMTRLEVARKVDEIIAFADLGDFIEQPIRVYSSGMVARLGFSVVSGLDPELLLIDEILAVGDMRFQEKCMAKMMGFKQQGVTMILVSHSMGDILKICDRVIWIENHLVKMVGEPRQVVESYLANV